MLKRIFNNLKKPHLIPIKIINKILNLYRENIYEAQKYNDEQNKLYNKLGLNRNEGEQKLDQIKKDLNFLNFSMESEHQTLFSSLSIKKKNYEILEIGTFDGSNSFLLSKLFPEANITTVDLKDDDEIFKNTYNRNNIDKFKKFCEDRNKTLSLSKNISFKQINSINLLFDNKKYDLIWVDGAHGYPIVTIDIINAIRLIKSDGIIMCDDVFTKATNNDDSIYNSIACYETLNALQKTNMIDFKLLYKRLDKKNNSNPNFRKFIAYVKLNSKKYFY